MPMPNLNQLEVKHIYSFSPFGDPKHIRGNKDMFKSTFRNTLQEDTPFFRDKMEPYNVKHGLVDPSHTFTYPLNHKTKKEKNYLAYDLKNGNDKSSTEL
jgi:hypothetical protein